MAGELDNEKETLRATLQGVLLTFSSRESQIEYQLTVGISVITELYCQWFDDVYHPDNAAWVSTFSLAERRAFEQFTEQLRRCEDTVAIRTLFDVIGEPCWSEVVSKATEALRVMRGSPPL